MKVEFQCIAVVGLGLIGGSLVKGLRRAQPACKIIGVDFEHVISSACQELDEAFLPENLAHALRDADLVFLAAPGNAILHLLPEVAKAIRPGALVTDVGSTKSLVVEQAKKHFTGERYFIGGHPMAGREKGGWEHADARLFENAAYVLTPASNFPAPLLDSFKSLLQALGARVVTLEAATHDRIVADISHLPQLLSVALMNFIAREGAQPELGLQLTAGGFRDMTRLAASPFEIWKDILAGNRANVQRSLQEFISTLQRLVLDFDHGDLEKDFQRANQLRQLIAPIR
ncbi:MAG: prephenate dehydrogenase/arogenate dehydrogenase family protein [candidate division KSB1 bacterium]|nr:prephenate dehydrogenase/arogenate dehydrogenase family protein [candidate division KSB1 bacterium]MDZ7366351.1 prephenate dehydrogenase/arogenate dehydrogenase family protein [candidate division KSB1 bacterium]MDZ7404006.1 prephenate dehydrogenase/arogenate dehydrogenase family protein [candidate division KSB1 bacterium]